MLKQELEEDDLSLDLITSCVEALGQSSSGSREVQDELAALEDTPLQVVSRFSEFKDDPLFPALVAHIGECADSSIRAKKVVVETYHGFSFLDDESFVNGMNLDLSLAVAMFVVIFGAILVQVTFALRALRNSFQKLEKSLRISSGPLLWKTLALAAITAIWKARCHRVFGIEHALLIHLTKSLITNLIKITLTNKKPVPVAMPSVTFALKAFLRAFGCDAHQKKHYPIFLFLKQTLSPPHPALISTGWRIGRTNTISIEIKWWYSGGGLQEIQGEATE